MLVILKLKIDSVRHYVDASQQEQLDVRSQIPLALAEYLFVLLMNAQVLVLIKKKVLYIVLHTLRLLWE